MTPRPLSDTIDRALDTTAGARVQLVVKERNAETAYHVAANLNRQSKALHRTWALAKIRRMMIDA